MLPTRKRQEIVRAARDPDIRKAHEELRAGHLHLRAAQSLVPDAGIDDDQVPLLHGIDSVLDTVLPLPREDIGHLQIVVALVFRRILVLRPGPLPYEQERGIHFIYGYFASLLIFHINPFSLAV